MVSTGLRALLYSAHREVGHSSRLKLRASFSGLLLSIAAPPPSPHARSRLTQAAVFFVSLVWVDAFHARALSFLHALAR